MKTTLEIDEGVMRELKKKAAHEGRTMSDLVETALRRLLRDEAEPPKLRPLPTWDGGGWTVDPADREALYEIFDAEDPLIQEMKTWAREPAGKGDRGGR
jgi:hypothetical protein